LNRSTRKGRGEERKKTTSIWQVHSKRKKNSDLFKVAGGGREKRGGTFNRSQRRLAKGEAVRNNVHEKKGGKRRGTPP